MELGDLLVSGLVIGCMIYIRKWLLHLDSCLHRVESRFDAWIEKVEGDVAAGDRRTDKLAERVAHLEGKRS